MSTMVYLTPIYELTDGDISLQVATPYVNHVPTMTGGVGYEDLARFYKVSDIKVLRCSAKLESLSIISQR
jgi:hypothetical protein